MGSPKIPWWKEYRQREQRQTMSVEMVVRRSFLEVLREYADNCSISGVQLMCDSKIGWLQRTARISFFGILVGLLWYLLYYFFYSTLTNPLIVSTESSTYPIGKIDFPAVAICNINRISKKAMQELAKALHADRPEFRNVSLENVRRFILEAGRLLDFSFDDKWVKGKAYVESSTRVKFNATEIVEGMKQLAPACGEMLLQCIWDGKSAPCESMFAVRRTARGHCCAFNYILDYDSATSPQVSSVEAKRQHLPGHFHGLSVVLDPMLEDYAYPVSNFKGFDILLYDSTHFPDLSAGRLLHRLAEPNYAEFLELKSIKQVASPEIRKYPLHIRKCLFKDELTKEFNGMYSYSACIVRCRIKAIQSLCKCTPYFLPAGKDQGSVCGIDDLKCLNKYKEKLLYLYPIDAEKTEGLEVEMEDSLYCPECLPDCELTQHHTKSFKTPVNRLRTRGYYRSDFTENINFTNKCILIVYHPVADGLFDRLDVVAYWFEVLSNIGGYGGVILGLSVFSVVEIVYFFIVRFIIVLRYNYIKYH